jgi:hypothetical protein
MNRNSRNGDRVEEELYAVQISRSARTGVHLTESWKKNGILHREDGPAKISRDRETGAVIREVWIRDNRLHRVDGPAVVSRDPISGRVKRRAWFINGVKITTPHASRPPPKSGVRRTTSVKPGFG